MKNFIYGDFESKYDRTVFKKIPGKSPEIIFFTQSGKELERLNIEKFDRSVYSVSLSNIVTIKRELANFKNKLYAYISSTN